MISASSPSVVFLHVPKTGGTTLRSIIARQYDASRLYEVGNPINEKLIAFRNMPEAQRHGLTAIQGHMSFGLHEWMQPPSTYITMLREPVRRAISDYAFVSSNTLHPLYPQVSRMSLSEYIKSGLTGQLENGMTRLICGDSESRDIGIPTVRQITSKDLDKAIANLEQHFSVVGLLERFDESLLLMRRALGWKLPVYVRENVTEKSAKPVVSESDRAIIRQYNAYDVALFEYCKERFEKAVAENEASLTRELATFRLANRAYAGLQLANWTHMRPRLGRLKRRLMNHSGQRKPDQ